MDEEVQDLLVKLSTTVEVVMNPLTPHQQRMEAYQASENFKETSPHCALCGFMMSSKENNHIIRHFGLQLLEHCVKYRWNTMEMKNKIFIKENTMKLLQEGTLDILIEQAHIKDAVSRIVVEMIKREWPQQWPTLMTELNAICQLGGTQAELVLMVFLRLAEDVLIFQTVPYQRRREIINALSEHMPGLFEYYMTTLEANYAIHVQLNGATDEVQKRQGQVACRVVVAVLNTMSAFFDWVNVSFLTDKNGILLEMLCAMLSDGSLQLHAAECMLVITNRKQKLEDRKPNLTLFYEVPMNRILAAAMKASEAPLDEYHYLFLKKLCQVLAAVGSQLCVLWGSCEGVSRPPNFEQYLTAILAFTDIHPSQSLGSITQPLWVSFLRHEHISKDEVFMSFIPRLVQSTRNTLVKVGFPSQSNSPSCAYARLDFDSDEDFNVFFSKYRAEVADMLRQATLNHPDVIFTFAAGWLKTLLNKPVDIGEARNHCNQSSPAFLEWDALTVCLESCMSRLHLTDKPRPPVADGIQLLQDVLQFETQDPLILSCLLSTISALFTFITDAPAILPTVLNKIFSSAVFNLQGQTKATRSKAVKNVRRHACSVLVKICKQYPGLLMPGFDHLYSHIKKLSSDPEELSQMEKGTLIEALILISNQFKNFERQSSFLCEVLAPIKTIWLSPEMKESLWSADKFLSYVGLDQPPVEPSSEDTCGINRSHILHCINTILAVMKRSVWPENIEAATEGGFIAGNPGNTVIFRNPATPHVLDMFDPVLAMSRTLNILWTPECLSKRHPAFQKAYDMQDADKHALLGIQPPCVDNTDATSCKHPLGRMQSFIANIHSQCYHLLGNAGQSMGHEFYQAPALAQSLLNSIFTNLDAIPVFRIRPIIRVFLKPYVQSCPPEYHQAALLPLISKFTAYILQRLPKEWDIVSSRMALKTEDQEENPESQEVIEEQVLRQMTREYLEFLGVLLKERRASPSPDESVMEEDAPPNTNIIKDDGVSELGLLVLSNEGVYSSILIFLSTSMGWPDTRVCGQSALLTWRIVKTLVEQNKLTSADINHLFMSVMTGLRCNGQHDSTSSELFVLILQFYENLRPKFPEMYNILLQVSGCKEQDLKTFDDKLMNNQLKAKNMRDTIRKLLIGIVGKNIGQQFKRDEKIANLPPLIKATRRKPAPVLSTETGDIGLCALFAPTDETSQQTSM